MANQLINATFLDGTNSWTAADAGASVNESTIGAPGRMVLSGGISLQSAPVAANGAAGVWAFGHYVGDSLMVRWLNAGGVLVSDVVLTRTRAAHGSPERGLAEGFNFARGWAARPAGATQFALRVAGATSRLMKPYASADGLEPVTWQPGSHVNPDLQYPVWPADLPAFEPEGSSCEPIPTRKGFAGDVGWEETRRTTRSRRYRFKGAMKLDARQYDRLMVWFDALQGPFWFQIPDTREIALASFLSDGEPSRTGGQTGSRRVAVGLQLRVS